MNAYQAGFLNKCAQEWAQLPTVKQAQVSGLASQGLSALLGQPALTDAASTYGAAKIGEIAKLLKMLKLLKGSEGVQGASMR